MQKNPLNFCTYTLDMNYAQKVVAAAPAQLARYSWKGIRLVSSYPKLLA
jgi:hypothetical protein